MTTHSEPLPPHLLVVNGDSISTTANIPPGMCKLVSDGAFPIDFPPPGREIAHRLGQGHGRRGF